ncbi:MAG: DUF6261 family protein [Tannerellaceae bacterium]|jgi:hypothetical protein|nr:DUF6261 family protein [Tannerellaceae bacterium]
MKILRFQQHRLKNEEWFEFYTYYKRYVDRYNDSKLGITEIYEAFMKLYRTVDRILQALRKSYFTTQLKDADKGRDNGFRNLYSVVKSFQGFPDAAKKDAALHLTNLLHSYQKNILQGSYAEESASIYNLLQDIYGDAYAADVDLLELIPWIKAMENAEKAFLALWEKRTQEEIAKPKENLADYRKQMDAAYSDMAKVIDAALIATGVGGDIVVDPESLDYASHDGKEEFDPTKHGNIPYNFVFAWNETVKKYRNLIAQRTGRNNKDTEEDVL